MKTALAIKNARIKKQITQLELANLLGVTDRAVSRWERGVGLPDASLWSDLSQILGISIETLLNGVEENKSKSINTLKSKLYYCNICGNMVHSYVDINISCCGQILNKESVLDSYEYNYNIEKKDGEHYLKVEHPMNKEHCIDTVIGTTYNKTVIIRLYPEQELEVFLPSFIKNIYIHDSKLGTYKLK